MDTYWTQLDKTRALFSQMTDPEEIARHKVSAEQALRTSRLTSDEMDGLEATIAAADDRLWELRHGHLP